MEGFMYRHHPQLQKANELVEDGAIGEVRSMYGRFAFNVDYDSSDWRGKKEAGGGSMMDQGCYMVNVLNHVAREAPDRVFCRTQYHPSNGLDHMEMELLH